MHPSPERTRPIRRVPDDPPPGGNPWVLVWTIVAAKAATIVAILAFSSTEETGGFVLATQWHWLLLLGALVAAPVAYAIRVRRVRARRDALRRSEWLIPKTDLSMPPVPGERIDRSR